MVEHPPPPVPTRSFFYGLSLPLKAVSLIARDRGLRRTTLFCWLITTLVILVSAILLWWGSARLMPFHWSDASMAQGVWAGLREWGTLLLRVLLYLTLMLAVCLTLPNLALAPLTDGISELAEARLLQQPTRPFAWSYLLRTTRLGLVHTVLRLGVYLAGWVPLFILHFVPWVGLFASVLLVLWTIVWLTVEYLSGPMVRHLQPFSKVLQLIRQNRSAALGLGSGLYVLLWLPIVNFFLVPIAVVAGTQFYVEVDRGSRR